MTCEPTHSAQAQRCKVTRKKYILDLLVTSVTTLQEVKVDVYIIFNS